MVERHVANVKVASSRLVSRSRMQREVRVASLFCRKAGWQSGHAAACKAVYAGSIPTPASNLNCRHCARRSDQANSGSDRPQSAEVRAVAARVAELAAGLGGGSAPADEKSDQAARGRGSEREEDQGPDRQIARVAKLVDAGDLKSPDRKVIQVRVLSRAPKSG